MDRTEDIRAETKLEAITDRLQSRHFNFIKKRIIFKENRLLAEHIALQAKIDQQYSIAVSKIKQKRKNLLDDFISMNETTYRDFLNSQLTNQSTSQTSHNL